MTTKARVLIADDEPLARRALRDHLGGVEWIGEIAEVGDGLAAIRAVETMRPELLFLDIMMPGASGIAVAEQIEHRPYIVFTTAFDRFAVTAFEIGALDYILKPFGRERVRAVLDRARAAMEHGLPQVAARAQQVLSAGKPLSVVFVKEQGRMVAVRLDDVERLEACDDYVALHAAGKRHLLHARMHDMHERLDAARFVRVHRSHVVNLRFVSEVEPQEGARLTIVMKSGARVPASRSGSARVRQLRAPSPGLRPPSPGGRGL